MRIIGIILLAMVSLRSDTISADSLFALGNRYFSFEKYDYALDAYSAILEEVEHPDLYFNMGNSYYKLNRIAECYYYYEKALILSPKNKDILEYFSYAKNMTLDSI